MEEGSGLQNVLVNIGLGLTYVLLLMAVAAILFFSIKEVFNNRKANGKFFIMAGILVGLFLIGWLISPYDFKWSQTDKGVTPTNSGIIGGALITVYFLLGIGVAVVAFFEVKRLVDKS